jgi:hypothetical protein
MYCIDIRDLGSTDDRRDIQVTLCRRGRPDAYGLIGEPNMQGFSVGFRMHRDRLDAHFLARPNDAVRDLAAVCDQNLSDLASCH